MEINKIKDEYDFSNNKYQNFYFLFEVKDCKNNIYKNVSVIATSGICAKSDLVETIGEGYMITEKEFNGTN